MAARANGLFMNKKILVIDDDENIQTLLRQLLKSLQYEEIHCVGTGLEALDYLTDHTPDLIFLDVDMPRMDGWLMCEIINNVKRWKKIPVVFQSALVGSENIKRGISLGAHSYLEKPYTREGVSEVLDAVFNAQEHEAPTTPEINMVVKQVAEATKQTFNLMLGAQTHILKVNNLDAKIQDRNWDFAGMIPAEGVADIEISMGWSRDLAASAACALMQMDPSELDDDLILDSMQEILNMVLGSAVRIIGKTFPVKLSLPSGGQDCGIPYKQTARHKFKVDVKTRNWIFPIVVTVVPPDQMQAA